MVSGVAAGSVNFQRSFLAVTRAELVLDAAHHCVVKLGMEIVHTAGLLCRADLSWGMYLRSAMSVLYGFFSNP